MAEHTKATHVVRFDEDGSWTSPRRVSAQRFDIAKWSKYPGVIKLSDFIFELEGKLVLHGDWIVRRIDGNKLYIFDNLDFVNRSWIVPSPSWVESGVNTPCDGFFGQFPEKPLPVWQRVEDCPPPMGQWVYILNAGECDARTRVDVGVYKRIWYKHGVNEKVRYRSLLSGFDYDEKDFEFALWATLDALPVREILENKARTLVKPKSERCLSVPFDDVMVPE